MINFVRCARVLWKHEEMAIFLRDAHLHMHRWNEIWLGIMLKHLSKNEKKWIEEAGQETLDRWIWVKGIWRVTIILLIINTFVYVWDSSQWILHGVPLTQKGWESLSQGYKSFLSVYLVETRGSSPNWCVNSPEVSGIRVKMINGLWSRRLPLSGSMLTNYDFSLPKGWAQCFY